MESASGGRHCLNFALKLTCVKQVKFPCQRKENNSCVCKEGPAFPINFIIAEVGQRGLDRMNGRTTWKILSAYCMVLDDVIFITISSFVTEKSLRVIQWAPLHTLLILKRPKKQARQAAQKHRSKRFAKFSIDLIWRSCFGVIGLFWIFKLPSFRLRPFNVFDDWKLSDNGFWKPSSKCKMRTILRYWVFYIF